ncbi:MAG TPA: 3-oxoacyl-ACP reductase FabG [Myxococcota bacterium]|nr:3-oxoacyl-ACP reductase FabG [Myxococcota bacterium]HRY92823.1 3-oxoacyl-ACP reductase FabG [Myxococcota bacterium]HSA19801.1 3-oxoacyl-ACP reductase FabG [Myxococcota bacterium]
MSDVKGTPDGRPLAVVTGGSRGIGRATCVELARVGYFVVVNYKRREDEAEATLESMRALGAQGEILGLDVGDRAAAFAKLEALQDRLGPVAVLVNNAGVTADGLFPMMSGDAWDKVMRTTLDGFFNVTRPLLKGMMKRRQGSIVNVASVSALVGNRGQVNYSAAKAGLVGATRSLAAEVARLGIRVNAVAPGLIETDMTAKVPRDQLKQLIPMNRVGAPEEVARVIRFLCSDDASYVTGQVLGVTGGMV